MEKQRGDAQGRKRDQNGLTPGEILYSLEEEEEQEEAGEEKPDPLQGQDIAQCQETDGDRSRPSQTLPEG